MAMRTVVTDTESLHAVSSGVIYNPFDKRLHAARCEALRRMRASPSSPKWHFERREAAETYLAEHHARWGGKPWQLADCCLRQGKSPIAPPSPRAAAPRTTKTWAAGGNQRQPQLRQVEDGFEVWSDEYVRNQSKSASTAGDLRRLIASQIRLLPSPAGRLLHATYAGDRWLGTDVENLLFNNLDQTLGLFNAPGVHGVRFEDLGGSVPRAPDGTTRSTYYAFRLSRIGESFAGVELGERICVVPEVMLADGPARLAARVWLAVRSARPDGCAPLEGAQSYALRVRVFGLQPAKNLKAIVDGASASMQQALQSEEFDRATRRLETLLSVTRDDLRALLTAPDAPLGAARRLLTLDGVHQVRVTPDDDRCVAAEIIAADDDGPPRLAVHVYAARGRTGRASAHR